MLNRLKYFKRLFIRYKYNFQIAFEAILTNKIRALSSAIGIMFGVASVISMLAIGNGARAEILEQLKHVGVNNIVIQKKGKVLKEEEGEVNPMKEATAASSGLSISDLESIKKITPNISKISPYVNHNANCMYMGKQSEVKIAGVSRDYFSLSNIELITGKIYSKKQELNSAPVCIIGTKLAQQLFRNENPLGKSVRAGLVWLEVIGVVNNSSSLNKNDGENIMPCNVIYTPSNSFLSRIKTNQNNIDMNYGGNIPLMHLIGEINPYELNIHQIEQILIQVEESSQLKATAKLIKRILSRRHNNPDNFEVLVPELLLKQEQKTKEIFNVVLGAIAGISLLVGGIGIMNIMYASVIERIKEIGIRLSVGGNKVDIKLQFILEASFISISGGFFGIFVGVSLSYFIQKIFDVSSIVTLSSILISFFISVLIGVLFGYLPANSASKSCPVNSLRHE